QQGLTLEAVDPATQVQRHEVLAPEADLWDGSLIDGGSGEFKQVKNGLLQPFDVPKARAAELSVLLSLRDKARAVMEMESTVEADTPELSVLRDDLLSTWKGYVDSYGPINRFSLRRTGRYEKVLDDLTGK